MYHLEAIDRIRNHNLDGEESLFLYVAFQSVHSGNPAEYPLQPPGGWLSKFKNIKHYGRRHYAAMVGAMDDAVGKVRSSFPIFFRPSSSKLIRGHRSTAKLPMVFLVNTTLILL